MPANTFHFKQFEIKQDKCAMKVGTDGMLLGAWADPGSANSILDIGTGTGLLALMLAQRSSAVIDAIEVELNAFEQAKENIDRSAWNSQIHVIHISLQEYSKISEKKYDLIISNPPYFQAPNRQKGNNKQTTYSAERAGARFNDGLTNQELITGVKKLLEQDGRLILILPVQESENFISLATDEGFFLNKKLKIKSRPETPEIRHILEFSFINKHFTEKEFIIYKDRNKYSDAYINLTKDYHAKNF